MPPPPLHPVQRRFLAEDLVRRRRADEHERFAASQRRGRIDPNPHQVDAVIFALRRIPEGGCILADEVGLGKTIEAGLVIAQLLAEGARRVLVIAPKSLLGQWQHELYTLFGIEVREGGREAEDFSGPGVFLAGREFAGGERGSEALRRAGTFDLCVIDEAHEIFAGIHRRYDREGVYQGDPELGVARMAHRVREVTGGGAGTGTPILLLTATPIQNSLAELWGLVQYVEPTGTLLGTLPTFRELFCAGDDRSLVPEQAEELRERIATVLKRTLRRQAQDFLSRPFVNRRARLFEYAMTGEERALYDDVTAWLLRPDLCAFRGRHRRLLLIGFHRRMASSIPALAASLRNVGARLTAMLEDGAAAFDAAETAEAFARDLDEDLADAGADVDGHDEPAAADPETIMAERELVRDFVRRAERLPADSKAAALVGAVRLLADRAARGEGSGKLVVFTESIATQDSLRELLVRSGVPDEAITLFRGRNDSPRARAALERWREEVEPSIPPYNRPSPAVAQRLALVHEFRTRSAIFISTEAGAKGLNLQFCESLVNYDLPWNPQRIEQRIGRCHRYGQERDVTVINFIAADNEAQRLTFEILAQKLDLFGEVLDASDVVLHEPSMNAPESLVSTVGGDFEQRLSDIYDHAGTIDDVTAELRELRDTVEERRRRFEATLAETRGLIESRLDRNVREVFTSIQEELPRSLRRLDRDVHRLVAAHLEAAGAPYETESDPDAGRIVLRLGASPALPAAMAGGAVLVIGHASGLHDADPLHLGHPLVRAAVDDARARTAGPLAVRVALDGAAPDGLGGQRGRRGRLLVTRVAYGGFERCEHLLVTAQLEGEREPMPEDLARALIDQPMHDMEAPRDPLLDPSDAALDDAVEEALFRDQTVTDAHEERRFRLAIDQIERFADDRALVLRRQKGGRQRRLDELARGWQAASGPDARAEAEESMRRVQAQIDELDAAIQDLVERRDAEYRRWRAIALARRREPPRTERLLEVEFRLE